MPQEEHVLVVERRVIEQVGMFQGLTFDVERYLTRIFAPGVPWFMPRSKAEADPTYKQLIPYVIVPRAEVSQRAWQAGGEKRLVGNRSIGIGGHINPADDIPLFSGDLPETYRAAVEREVAEEVSLDGPHTERVVAPLNDDSTEVGRVHLGVVHYWSLATPTVRKREQMMTQLDFLGTDELQQARDEMETWSQFCFDHLSEMDRRGVSYLTPSDSITPLNGAPRIMGVWSLSVWRHSSNMTEGSLTAVRRRRRRGGRSTIGRWHGCRPQATDNGAACMQAARTAETLPRRAAASRLSESRNPATASCSFAEIVWPASVTAGVTGSMRESSAIRPAFAASKGIARARLSRIGLRNARLCGAVDSRYSFDRPPNPTTRSGAGILSTAWQPPRDKRHAAMSSATGDNCRNAFMPLTPPRPRIPQAVRVAPEHAEKKP